MSVTAQGLQKPVTEVGPATEGLSWECRRRQGWESGSRGLTRDGGAMLGIGRSKRI